MNLPGQVSSFLTELASNHWHCDRPESDQHRTRNFVQFVNGFRVALIAAILADQRQFNACFGEQPADLRAAAVHHCLHHVVAACYEHSPKSEWLVAPAKNVFAAVWSTNANVHGNGCISSSSGNIPIAGLDAVRLSALVDTVPVDASKSAAQREEERWRWCTNILESNGALSVTAHLLRKVALVGLRRYDEDALFVSLCDMMISWCAAPGGLPQRCRTLVNQFRDPNARLWKRVAVLGELAVELQKNQGFTFALYAGHTRRVAAQFKALLNEREAVRIWALFNCSDIAVFREFDKFAQNNPAPVIYLDILDAYDMCPYCFILFTCLLRRHNRVHARGAFGVCYTQGATGIVPTTVMYPASGVHPAPTPCNCRAKFWRLGDLNQWCALL